MSDVIEALCQYVKCKSAHRLRLCPSRTYVRSELKCAGRVRILRLRAANKYRARRNRCR